MNILAVGCIHNDVENLLPFIDRLAALKFDVIICPGDFTDSLLPKGFTRNDVAALIIEELRSLKRPVFVVPGSWDKDLIGFFDNEGISIHGAGQVYKGVGFFGFGGARTPFNLPFEPTDVELTKGLTSAYQMVEKAEFKVMVTHAPPANTKVDMITSGAHVGSDSVRKFIENTQPDVAICAHIHESRGSDTIGRTHLINCGRLPEGHCGIITLEKGNVGTKIVNLI